VVESTPGFLSNLSKLAQASASWDGTDPLRMLGPDGRAR
jgi:hypothetical protein